MTILVLHIFFDPSNVHEHIREELISYYKAAFKKKEKEKKRRFSIINHNKGGSRCTVPPT